MATQNFINECKNRANANRLGRFELQMYDRFEKEFKGNTYQQTYTGKNLCGIPDQTVTTNGVTVTIKNGEITLNGTSTGSLSYITPIDTTTLSGNYSLNVIYISGSMSGSTNRNFNVRKASDNSNIFGTTFQTSNNYSTHNFTTSTEVIFGIYGANTAKFTNYKFKVQLVAGTSSDYNYEPYVGGTSSPNPSYPQPIENVTGRQEIKINGKNFFSSEMEIGSLNSTGTNVSNENCIRTKDFIDVLPDTIYTISNNRNYRNHTYEYDKNYNFIKSYLSDNISSFTFTTSENTKYIKVRTNQATVENNLNTNFQLEEGSTATTYEPYKGNTYEVNLGKNLINNTATTQTINGITYTINEDKTVLVNGTATRLSYINIIENNSFILKKGTYTISGCPSGGSDSTYRLDINDGARDEWKDYGNGKKFTLTEDFEIRNMRIRIANGATVDNLLFKPMLEKGSQATSYSPYFTPTELNKIIDYEDSIKKSTGKNLFDKNNANLINCSVTSSGISNTEQAKMLYIPVQPNTEYTISKIQSARFRAGTTTEIPAAGVQISNYISSDNSTSITITTGATSKYLFAFVYISTADTLTEQQILDSIQVEENTEATSYEPYLPKGTWYLEKNTRKLELAIADMNNSTDYPGWTNVSYIASDWPGLNTSVLYGQGIRYKHNIGIQTTTGPEQVAFKTTTGYSTLILSKTYWNLTQNQWKSTYPDLVFTIIYNLQIPEYITITNTELINQLESIELLKGTNNISITSADLPIIFDYSFWNGDTEVDEDDRFLEVNQSNYLTSIELKDSCCVNNNILGTTYTKSAEVELLDLPVGTKLESQIITPEIGVKYNDDTTEYETFDDYVIESLSDEQTASNTKFIAMNGSTLLDKEYICSLSFENGQTHTINEFYQDACNQIGLIPTDSTFDNGEIVMTGNPFTNKETIRTVISEVEKTSCSIAKFDWKNKTISLTWLSDQIDYEFNTSDYSTLEGSLTQYGPLNTIIIANTQLNGENVVMTDQESVEKNGEHQIIIDSPYFLYTEDLRTQAIQAIYNKLDGLTYYDLKLTTPYGKPFLDIGNKIRINTNENQVYDTYVLSHTFKYDGTFSSIIESPALTQEEQTIKNEFKGNSVREKLRRTELIVDKTTGDITAITDRVTTVENEFGDVYSKEEVNTLVQNSATGLTNNFINSGGNNLLRNTGLWFEDRSEIEYMYPSNDLYPDDELFMNADPHWEYWKGNAKKIKEEKASNMSGILLQTGYLEQQQQLRNGTYALSFKYRKLVELASVNVQINDRYIELNQTGDNEVVEIGDITTNNVNIKIFSDTDDSCVIYDLMLNAGSEKAEYSQHQNETTTDTVNISKGITISSSDTNTTFKANTDGIRIYNSKDMDNPVTDYTDTGMNTNRIKVKEEAEVVKVLWKDVGNSTWLTRL